MVRGKHRNTPFRQTSFPINFNPLNAELNPICHLLALVGAHHMLHVSRVRVNALHLKIKPCLVKTSTA